MIGTVIQRDRVLLVIFGLCLVPIAPEYLKILSLNTETLILGLWFAVLPLYWIITSPRKFPLHIGVIWLTLCVVCLMTFISIVATKAHLDFGRATINVLFAGFILLFVVVPLHKKRISVGVSFACSIALLITAYIAFYGIVDGKVLGKNYTAEIGYNVNAYLNLFNLAIIFVFFLCAVEARRYGTSEALIFGWKSDKVLLNVIAAAVLLLAILQFSRQNFICVCLIIAAINRDKLKYFLPIIIASSFYIVQSTQIDLHFSRYFYKAVSQVTSGEQTTRLEWIIEGIAGIQVAPSSAYSHPLDNTFLTLLLSGGLLTLPIVFLILSTLVNLARTSIFIAAAFLVLVLLNDQHLELTFWLTVLYVNFISFFAFSAENKSPLSSNRV